MTTNESNHGYLPAMVKKEILAGRKCEITGGVCRHLETMDDYNRVLPQMRGKFGEIIQWKADRTALIATRPLPMWAIEVMERHLEEADEMARWIT